MAMPSAEVGIRERLNNDQNPTEPLLGTGQPDLVPPKFSLVRAQLWCILLNFLIEFFDMVIIVPQLVLFERSLCYSYYRLHEKDGVGPRGIVEERSCKIERIQQELAVLRGWKALFDALPVFVVAVPLGTIADMIGRKKVLMGSILGSAAGLLWTLLVCYYDSVFSIRFVWLSAVFYMFGSTSSANAMVYSMAADSCSESNRSQVFYYIYSTYLLCELLAPAIASFTIEASLLIPFGLGLLSLALCISLLIIIPETHNPSTHLSVQRTPAIRNETDTDISITTFYRRYFHAYLKTLGNLIPVFRNRNMLLAFTILLINAFRPATLAVLLQYVTIRFGWKTSQTAILLSEVAVVNIVLFLFLLPQLIMWISSRWRVEPQFIDWTIVFVSLFILAAGAFSLGLASSIQKLLFSLLLFGAGFGTRVSTLSLVTVWAGENIRARVFGLIQIIENLGKLCAEPFLMKVFAASLELPEYWLGLPFFTTAGIYCLGAVTWKLVRINRPRS